jgi:DNA glycosylase AlkZ-like
LAGKQTATAERVVNVRVLNRTLLDRQFLLARADLSVTRAVEHLVGLQAQAPDPPYLGLWTRLRGFEPGHLSRAFIEREVVRIVLQRGTIHLVTADDCVALRPVLQPVLDRQLRGIFGRQLGGVDLAEVAAVGRALVEEEPLTFSALGKMLAERWPGVDPFPLSQAVRNLVPLVQIPPRGVWGSTGRAIHTSADVWLGRSLATNRVPDDMVLRYLAAFGPASLRDIGVWSGLTGLKDVGRRLSDRLRSYRDENGVELLDLADHDLADPDTPAPVRFMPEFDNVLLSHADRTRIMAHEYRSAVFTNNGAVKSVILVDGFVAGRWRIEKNKGAAILTIEPFRALTKGQRTEVCEEGARLLAAAADGADTCDVRISAVIS